MVHCLVKLGNACAFSRSWNEFTFILVSVDVSRESNIEFRQTFSNFLANWFRLGKKLGKILGHILGKMMAKLLGQILGKVHT